MKKIVFFLVWVIPFTGVSAHNTGSITGKVTETKTGLPVAGCNIYLKETIIGTITDIGGKFEIRNIQIGKYEIVCSAISYKVITRSAEVRENETAVINFEMEESPTNLKEVTVQGSLPLSAASSQQVRKIDMQLRPFRTSQDMLMMTPGLVIAQHAGGGKAEQIFIRGFDCDHGTDISINVDNIPVNLVSHAHGQGYADMHFLIAETVEDMEINKGPYFTRFGNFSTAGAISFKTKDVLDNSLVKIEAGQFNTQKYTLMYQIDNGGAEQNGYIAAQYYHTDGPFETPQKLQRMNVFAKYFIQMTQNSKLTLTAGGFNSGWNASGQIPVRAVQQDVINRYGAIDNLEGGATDRGNLSLAYKFRSPNGNELDIQTFLSHYNFKLFSNFTYFLTDSIKGDMIEQTEHRNIHGINAAYKFASQLGTIHIINRLGTGYRGDNIDPQLWHSPGRNRISRFTDDDLRENNFFIWGEQEYFVGPRMRMILGIRHDYFTFSKNDHTDNAIDSTGTDLPHGSGYAGQSVFSPKFNIIFQPLRNVGIYLNFGQGFHSNDARDVVINSGPLSRNTSTLPKATGGEIGFRTSLFNRLHISLAGWYLYLEKELVYVGDGGTTELSNPTRRMGIDAEGRYSFLPWLWLDADVSLSNGKIQDLPEGENHIPLAPTLTASGGINIIREKGITGSLRFRHIADRPADEQDLLTAAGYTLLNGSVSYKIKNVTISLCAENIMNVDWNEAQFATETRLKGEAQGTTEICFTPGNPRNFQVSAAYIF